jgi:16S rRNA processing protein RimM
MKETQVLVGEITAPFGVQGEVKLQPYVDSLDVLTRFSVVYLQSLSGNSCETRITKVRLHQGDTLIARVEAIADRDAADAWRHTKIYVNRSDMPPLAEGVYYEWELLGITVVTESGKPLGVIEKIHQHPANDVYETEVAMIPAVEAFVKSVDITGKQMVVIDMPGLRKDE